MTWLMATAMASETSTPGWCVPLDTGLPSTGFTELPSGGMISMVSAGPEHRLRPGRFGWSIGAPRARLDAQPVTPMAVDALP